MEDMVSKLKKPRRVMLLVKAGAAVDAFIDKLVIVISLSNLTFEYFNKKGIMKIHMKKLKSTISVSVSKLEIS